MRRRLAVAWPRAVRHVRPARRPGAAHSLRARTALSLALLLPGAIPGAAVAQERARLVAQGPGEPGVLLARALAGPYELRTLRGGSIALRRDSSYSATVLVVGGDATVASTVRGDVIVVGGNLFLHPGARIAGRAVAIGGGVYNSTLASVAGGLVSYPEVTYRTARDSAEVTLAYAAGPLLPRALSVTLPGLRGLRVPAYSRVDGLVLSAGPRFSIAGGGAVLDPLITYRSDLGTWDPSLTARALLPARFTLEASGGRATVATNAWTVSDIGNTLSVLARGRDYRNYWRADRFEVRLLRDLGAELAPVTVGAGLRTERDWSVAAGGPWSVTGNRSPQGILRPNPAVVPGRLSSVLLAARAQPVIGDVQLTAGMDVELPWQTPTGTRWVQTTVDASVDFPTFGAQRLAVRARATATAGGDAAPQRFHYLGGLGTLITLPPLAAGGDELLFVDSRYDVPLPQPVVPYLGAPVVSVVSRLGAAGVHRLPRLQQELGLRLTLGPVYAEAAVNPVTHRTALVASLVLLR